MLIIKFRQIIETDPTLAIHDAVKFLGNLFFRVASTLHNLPKSQKLVFFNRTVPVDVDLVEKFGSGNLCKTILPVLQCFGFINLIAAVNVENTENLANFRFESRGQLLLRLMNIWLTNLFIEWL